MTKWGKSYYSGTRCLDPTHSCLLEVFLCIPHGSSLSCFQWLGTKNR